MNSRLLLALAAVLGSLALGLGQASAGPDPDSRSAPNAATLLPVQIDSALLALNDPLDEASLDYTSTVGVSDTAAGIDAAPASSSTSSSSSNTLLVDDDKVQCPTAPYMTIQAAVNASGPNDTIKVCPGTYNEQVRIGPGHDGLKVESTKPLQAIIKWPTVELPPLALVYINQSDRVRIRAFTMTGPWTFGGCTFPRHEGVSIENSYNDDIVGNHITEIRNANPALRGCQEGDAVAIGMRNYPCGSSTIPGSARVEFNWIDKYQKNGVQDVNAGSFADIDHNVITGSTTSPTDAATNSVVVCSAAGRVHHNVISGNHYTSAPTSSGIILTGAPSGSIVDHNKVFGNDYGVYADSESGVKISHNDVIDNFAEGITLCGEASEFCNPFTNSTVDGNDVDRNDGSGILLLGANSNQVKSNQVEKNGTAGPDTTDGIRVNSTSGNNQIRNNFMDDNVTHDCHDDSVGGGTAFTANFWFDNRGETENKVGLCTRHPHDDDEEDDD